MTRVERGDVFYSFHPKHRKTEHWFIVVSERTLHRRCVAVMITDARNIQPPPIDVPAGTTISRGVRLSKRSTIHDADAFILRWEQADLLVQEGAFARHSPEANPDLVAFGRAVLDASDGWEDDLNDYVLDVNWTSADTRPDLLDEEP